MTNLRQAEPVSHAVIAGALFDFMGWLTTRDERLVLSGADETGPAVEAITAFSKMRGLSLDDAKVQDWQDYTTPPQQQAEPPPEWPLIKNILAEYGLQAIGFVADWKATMAEQQCQWPKCQNDGYQKILAKQIQQELFTGRPWVDMTDEEMDTVVNSNMTITDSRLRDGVFGVMLDTAALLKERNK